MPRLLARPPRVRRPPDPVVVAAQRAERARVRAETLAWNREARAMRRAVARYSPGKLRPWPRPKDVLV